jgi:hypothetical protein
MFPTGNPLVTRSTFCQPLWLWLPDWAWSVTDFRFPSRIGEKAFNNARLVGFDTDSRSGRVGRGVYDRRSPRSAIGGMGSHEAILVWRGKLNNTPPILIRLCRWEGDLTYAFGENVQSIAGQTRVLIPPSDFTVKVPTGESENKDLYEYFFNGVDAIQFADATKNGIFRTALRYRLEFCVLHQKITTTLFNEERKGLPTYSEVLALHREMQECEKSMPDELKPRLDERGELLYLPPLRNIERCTVLLVMSESLFSNNNPYEMVLTDGGLLKVQHICDFTSLSSAFGGRA